MSVEFFVLVILWVISIITLLIISKGRTRLTQITFLFTQALAWIFEFIITFFKLVEFPYREFKVATEMSFSLYYIVFPTVGVLFILYYPKQLNKLKLLFYYLFFSMVIPIFTFSLERYSKLFHFINWNWTVHVLADLLIFYILKTFIFWFQKGLKS
ncbi:CBO0543 family protein [Bacillus sp. 31A1R]|uniref:CBO0543 family protein n=1 Tax=Robertmurraya mangrovi TaxID=3098077 RepID=A0ABU5IYY9_9BACI|nr:CBO0543 family protein [Bacillus sp. 31A1R]MDZ5472385.1 CBO0543 family protein [Bacillus sp. 31A1R]